MGDHHISLACRGSSFFSGYIIDHESRLISEFHLRNEHIYPCSTMSRSVEGSRSSRLTCISTYSVNIAQFFKLRQNPLHSSIDEAAEVLKLTEGSNVSCWVMRNDICMGVVKNTS